MDTGGIGSRKGKGPTKWEGPPVAINHNMPKILFYRCKDDLEEVVLCEDCLHQSLHILCSHIVQCCLILLVIVDAMLKIEIDGALPV